MFLKEEPVILDLSELAINQSDIIPVARRNLNSELYKLETLYVNKACHTKISNDI